MNQFQSLWSSAASALSDSGGQQSGGSGGESATVKAAEAISETVADKKLPADQKEMAGSAVHYGFGTLVGTVYGAASELVPAIVVGSGLAYGAALWLLADEIGVPAFRLSPPPTEAPASSHVSAFTAHLAYGYVLDRTRQILLKIG
jgi:uncharacterized membrane protein YagU involved in acid resistance